MSDGLVCGGGTCSRDAKTVLDVFAVQGNHSSWAISLQDVWWIMNKVLISSAKPCKPIPLKDLITAEPSSVFGLASASHRAPDLSIDIMERLAFGIPVKKWLDILCAARTMVANAEKECGGDGNGCLPRRQWVTTRCVHCPMTQIDELRELMK